MKAAQSLRRKKARAGKKSKACWKRKTEEFHKIKTDIKSLGQEPTENLRSVEKYLEILKQRKYV